MSYFPESIMPARAKSEASDVDGNKYIIGGADHNRLDEEIRALEKAVGVPVLPVQGFSSLSAVPGCSVSAILSAIYEQLLAIRDNQALTTSGVVTVLDSDVVGYSGFIQFPSSWDNTTLEDDIPDATEADEDDLEPLDEVRLADVDGLPEEGFVTIINDVSLGKSVVVHGSTLRIFSPAKANAKVEEDFSYDIQVSGAAGDVTYSATGLPAGLSVTGASIEGTPTIAGTSIATVTARSAGQTATLSLTIKVVASNTPNITNSPLAVVAESGNKFVYEITYDGTPTSIAASGLPGGLTIFGSTITGTPRTAGEYTVVLTATDQFGDTDTKNLVITVI